jgi:hypothetical protein
MLRSCSRISVNEGLHDPYLQFVRRFRANEVGATSIIMGVLMIR